MTWQHHARHVLVLAAGYLLSLAAALGLLGPYHGYRGQSRAGQLVVLFMFPLTATAITAIISSLQRRRLPAQDNGSADAAIRGIVLWVIAFLITTHTLLVGVLVGATWLQPWAIRTVIVALGLTLVGVGNLLPRTRPNMAIGIRTARTLADRQLWMLTHRTSGYLAVAVGAVTVFAGLFLRGPHVAGVPFIAFAVGAVIVLAVYLRQSLPPGHRA